MRWLALFVLVGCADDSWPVGSTIRAFGPPAFVAEVHEAIGAWTAALEPCPFPYVVDDTGNTGHPISLINPDGWDCDEAFSACENGDRINVKGPEPTGHVEAIEHELGHAFGLEHSKTPGALMYWQGGVLGVEDAQRARDALGCAP